jgi:hypothetical protein
MRTLPGGAVDVTAQQRSWMQRSRRTRYRWAAGLVVTLGSVLGPAVIAQPAAAVNPMADLNITAPPSFNQGDTHNVVAKLTNITTSPGDSIAVSLTIGNAAEVATNDFWVTRVTVGTANCPNLTNDGFTCTYAYDGSPTVAITYTLQNKMDTAPVGGSKTFDRSVIAVNDLTVVTVTNSISALFSLTLLGPPRDTTISGNVDDTTTGRPVSGALVNLHDSAHPAHSYSTRTDSRGRFSFPVDGTHPVVAGQVFASAAKNGYKTHIGQPKNFTPGTPISGWRLLVILNATPTPSQTPSASPTGLPIGARASPVSGAPSGGGSEAVPGGATLLASSNGSGSDLFKYVLIGGLILILAGTAGIMIMLIRRRHADDGGEVDGDYQPDYPAYPASGPRDGADSDAAYPDSSYPVGGGYQKTKGYPSS